MKNNMELALNAVPERSGVMNGELELICKATTKNSDAFIQITDSVKDKLYHTAYVILGTEADACDPVMLLTKLCTRLGEIYINSGSLSILQHGLHGY